jgi:gentisate 1,2-dioxygenase
MNQAEFQAAVKQAANMPTTRTTNNTLLPNNISFAEFLSLANKSGEVTTYRPGAGRQDVVYLRNHTTPGRGADTYSMIPLRHVQPFLSAVVKANSSELFWSIAEPITAPASNVSK